MNNTGADITEFQVEYTVWIINDQSGSSSFNLAQSADNATYTMVGDPLVSAEAEDANGFAATEVMATVTPDRCDRRRGPVLHRLGGRGRHGDDGPR